MRWHRHALAPKILAVAAISISVLINPAPAWALSQISVDPGTYLSAGNAVSVSWVGARAQNTITIRQCSFASGITVCEEDPSSWTVLPASAEGSASFVVAGDLDLIAGLHTCEEWNCAIEIVSDLTPGEIPHDYDVLEVQIHFSGLDSYGDPEPGDPTQVASTQTGAPPDDSPETDIEDEPPNTTGHVANLPLTGSSVVPIALTAATLGAVGMFLLAVTRRRSRPAALMSNHIQKGDT